MTQERLWADRWDEQIDANVVIDKAWDKFNDTEIGVITRVMLGMNRKEIAAHQEIPLSTVEKAVSSFRQKIKRTARAVNFDSTF